MRTVRPSASGGSSTSSTPAASSDSRIAAARSTRASRAAGSSSLSVSRCVSAAAASPGPVGHVEQHRVGHVEPGSQRLGLGGHEPVERRPAPRRGPVRRLLAHDPAQLLRVVAGLGDQPLVLDLVLRGLDDDRAVDVEPGTPSPAGDLVELAGPQQPGAPPVVLGQGGDQDGADRDVDPHAQGVGPAHHLEQPGSGQLLDEASVARQHPRVVHADPVAHEPGQGAAEPGGEPEVPDARRRSRPSPRGCTR